MEPRQVISIELAIATFRVLVRSPRAKVLSPPRPWARGLERPRPGPLLLFVCAGHPLSIRGPVPRRPSHIDCWLLAQISTTTVWRRLWERQFSMHLRSRNLPRPSASSPLDNRAPPMANASQVPDLEGLHHEIHGMAEQMRVMNENNAHLIQLLVAANPQPPAAPSVPDVERSRHSNRSGDRSHNVSTERARVRRRAPSPSLRERSSSSESSHTRARVRRGRSPNKGNHTEARDKSTSQKIRDLDARLDAINTGTNAPVTVDALLGIYEGKTDPMDHLDSYKSLMSLQGCSDEVMCKAFSATLKGPARSWFRKLSPGTIDSFGELSRLFVANFMSCRNRQKNASHLFTVHQKETESLKDFVKRFNQAILEVEDPSDKVIIMAMMEGLRPGPLFDSLSKNVPETLSALQSKADKYIAAEELAEAKRRRPRTPPRRPEFILPPLNAPVAQLKEQIADLIKRGYLRKYITDRPPPNSPERRYGDNRPTAGNIQTIHGGFGSGGCSTSSRKKHARTAFRSVEEEVYNLSSPCVGDQPPITFSSDDLRGLHLPHDDALVISAVIANFNVQRILIDSGSSADILFISAFEKMKIGLDKLHPFHTPLIEFGGNTTQPLGWINLPITLGTEPHQTTVWQDFIVVDCPSPYNAILGRPTLGGIKAITSTYHLKMKFPTLTGIGEVKGDQKVARQCFISAMRLILEDPRETENTKPLEEVVSISIHPNYPDRQVMIGTELTDELRIALIDFLKKNSDVFAWSQGDVPGIDPEVALHKLFTKPEYSPVHQKRRKFAPERLKVIEDEVNKLIKANHGCGAGLVIRAPSGEQMEYAIRMGFKATNNEAEYEALLAGLRVATELGAQSLEVFSDSQLVVNQVQGDYLAKDARMIAYLGEEHISGIFSHPKHWNRQSGPPSGRKPDMDGRNYCLSPGRFGIPKVIISDNARQFDNDRFRLFCSDLAISHHFSSPGHPQANGQVEVTNRTILRNLKARYAELQNVILRQKWQRGELRLNLDLLDEKRKGKRRITPSSLQKSDRQILQRKSKAPLVPPWRPGLVKGNPIHKRSERREARPNMEGPYKVIKVSRPGTYWLEDLNGKALLHPWNAEHLKKYYQ
ncbi:hypothetical protein Acr_27g0000600 [Actinidia rufa]|uniref:Integrase catalytic domain-containing protein n=1 Tax=Actinidia rufa TaxID=165716 RepID=A0A7J0H5L4_9ERIC|nr:hypothetical protein Acr_27g0000600 [Actinidia rufa]